MVPPAHLLFDLDGTLTNPAPGIVACLRYALAEMGAHQPREADLKRFIGPPLDATFRELLGTSAQPEVDAAIGHYRARFTDVGLFENSLYPGIPEALEELIERGHELRVATSKPHVFANRIVDHFGLRAYFRRVYGSELSGERADKGDLIQHVLDRESLESGRTCMIGDRRYDVVGAQQHGLFSIGVLWGFGDHRELESAMPHRIVERVDDLAGVVRELTETR